VFTQAAREKPSIDTDDLKDLRFLPVVDAFHHFAHDVVTDRLRHKAVAPELARYALHNLPVLKSVFPGCGL
jgi:hypothetical protein